MIKCYYKGKRINKSKFEGLAYLLIYADYTLTHEEKHEKHLKLINGEIVDGLQIMEV